MADEQPAKPGSDFRSELKQMLNRHSMDNGTNTPDFILADYMIRCLDNFTETTQAREKWYDVKLVPGRNTDDNVRT